jgi:hypothetical protein
MLSGKKMSLAAKENAKVLLRNWEIKFFLGIFKLQ